MVTYSDIEKYEKYFARAYQVIYKMNLGELRQFQQELREALVLVIRKTKALTKNEEYQDDLAQAIRKIILSRKINRSSQRLKWLKNIRKTFETYESDVALLIREIEEDHIPKDLIENLVLPISHSGKTAEGSFPLTATYESFDFTKIIDNSWFPVFHNIRGQK